MFFFRKSKKFKPITLLIDGPDLCGKSTLVASLSLNLEKLGYNIIVVKGAVRKTRFHNLLNRFDANKHHANSVLNSLYILALLFDRGYPNESCDVLICESHIDRVIAYGVSCNLKSIAMLALRLRWIFRKFDIRILLAAPHATRVKRLHNRINSTVIDKKTTSSQIVTDRFHNAFKHSFSGAGDVSQYDTELESTESITSSVILKIEQEIHKKNKLQKRNL